MTARERQLREDIVYVHALLLGQAGISDTVVLPSGRKGFVLSYDHLNHLLGVLKGGPLLESPK